MNKNIILLVVALCLLAYFTYTNYFKKPSATSGEYKKMNQQDAKKLMDTEDLIVLDVRTKEEYQSGHIQKAINLSSTEISNITSLIPNKGAKILVYCRSGARSRASVNAMLTMGYTNVVDIGGIMSWPYDIVK